MKKYDYLEMLLKENEAEVNKKELYFDVIDCTDIALSQTPEDFEIDNNVTVKDLFSVIEEEGRNSSNNCVGPFQAAVLIAERLGTKYVRPSERYKEKKVHSNTQSKKHISLEDFL